MEGGKGKGKGRRDAPGHEHSVRGHGREQYRLRNQRSDWNSWGV